MIASDREGSTIAEEGLDAALRDAAEQGDMAAMETLVARGADVNAKNEHGSTALHCAALNGQLAAMQWLVAHGADINAVSDYGRTVLRCAAAGGHVAALQWLVAHGAGINAVTGDGRTALHCAAQAGHVAAMQWLVGQVADFADIDQPAFDAINTEVNNFSEDDDEDAQKTTKKTGFFSRLTGRSNDTQDTSQYDCY
jgi:ankyrin repeat protein